VSIDTVLVGNPGNAADTQVMHDGTSGYGAVNYNYRIGKYDVTVAQYAAFLNAVGAADTYALYNANMAGGAYGCGITRNGVSGSYTYSVVSGREDFPVNHVSFGDAARFANWLHNGQPNGSQEPTTTEDGSYYLNGAMTNAQLMPVTRKPNATWVLPTENEWYKAAYYDPQKPGGSGYWLYPTKSNSVPSNTLSSVATNNANFADPYPNGYTDPTNYLTPVGAFASSPGPYATFDQGGNVRQWNEAFIDDYNRGSRAGTFAFPSHYLASYNRGGDEPWNEYGDLGLRMVLVEPVPEPSMFLLIGIGAAGLLASARRQRKRGQGFGT
jgi:formylglycine-generating enzyme required for sulfatase activity